MNLISNAIDAIEGEGTIQAWCGADDGGNDYVKTRDAGCADSLAGGGPHMCICRGSDKRPCLGAEPSLW